MYLLPTSTKEALDHPWCSRILDLAKTLPPGLQRQPQWVPLQCIFTESCAIRDTRTKTSAHRLNFWRRNENNLYYSVVVLLKCPRFKLDYFLIWFLNIDSISFFVSSLIILFFITWFLFVSFGRYFFFQVTFGWWWFLFSLIFDRFTLVFWGAHSSSTIGTRMTLAFCRRTRFWIWKSETKIVLYQNLGQFNAHINRELMASITFSICFRMHKKRNLNWNSKRDWSQ